MLICQNTDSSGHSQVRTEPKNAIGKLVSVVDAKSGITQFAYDLAGNLRQTIDPNGNIITVTSDLYGRKTDLRDPDLGWIHYELDPLGRVLAQTSPKQRDLGASTTKPHLRTLMEYDLLDRMTARYEMDLESHWVFDSAPNGKGLLWESYTGPATAKTYFRTHSYDVLSRPQQTVEQLADGQYRSSIIYDAWGRVIQQSYQRQQNATKAFATRYNKFGFAERFERGGLVLGAIKSMDAAARPTSILLGNGLLATQNYYVNTGRLDTSNLAPNGNSAQIRLAQKYEYDKLGNVTLRSQSWDANDKFTERFDYDVLNRISFSRVDNQAQQNFTYDAVGNLLSKTGVGTGSYVYPTQGVNAVRPHAPQSIPGIGSFEYDNNGNLINGAGRSITWTSFDMPLQISKGSITAKFSYGPEHNRIKQERSDGSTEIYAGAQIVEKDAAGILTIKTYWPAGLGLEIDRPQASNSELNWTHVDKLGSVIAITDEAGNFREKMAYDAWGKRRTLSGAAINGTATPDNIDGKVDHRGFTNHEMLDQLDLVHMNGRIYEPLLARFLSADPILQDPLNGQSYNRYAYVMNNPTNLTDPTGFEATTNNAEKSQKCVFVTGSSICNRGEIAAAIHRYKAGVQSEGSNSALHNEVETHFQAAYGMTSTQNAKSGAVGDAGKSIAPNSANAGSSAMLASGAEGNVMPASGIPQTPMPKSDETSFVERHVEKNLCAYRNCNPWEKAQAAFVGVAGMVGEAWGKFTVAVGSILPVGRATETAAFTSISYGAKATRYSAVQLEVNLTQAQAIENLAENGFVKAMSKDGSVTIMSSGDKVYRFYPASTGGSVVGAPSGIPSASVSIMDKIVTKLRFLRNE